MPEDEIRLEHAPRPGDEITLAGPGREALTAWRPRPGLAVTVTGPAGQSARARITGLDDNSARLFVFETMPGPAESHLELIVLQALPDKERMELIIEKATELGVDLIVPWTAARGTTLAEREARQPKAHRFAARALKAAKQCRRAKIPAIAPVVPLESALAFAAPAALKVALWENAAAPLREVIARAGKPAAAVVLIGPEGGITESEIKTIEQHGFIAATLGARILRTETAAIAAISIMQFCLGDLGGV